MISAQGKLRQLREAQAEVEGWPPRLFSFNKAQAPRFNLLQIQYQRTRAWHSTTK
jgi:hypothetical protein